MSFIYDTIRISNRLDALSGGHITTTNKGDLIADDGTSTIALAAGTDGNCLLANSGETSGLEWRDLVVSDVSDFTASHGSVTTGVHGVSGNVVGTTDAQTLTNKTLTDSTTWFQDNADTTKKLQFELSGITSGATRTMTIPNEDTTLVGTATTQILTGKTIDSDNNTITNIVDGDIKATAAIDATKIADGSVTNTEFQRLNAVTSAVVGVSDAQTLTNKTWGDSLDMNANKIIGLATPTADTDASTKAYVDSVASGLDVKTAVMNATTVDLDSNGSISGVITYNATAGTSLRGQITATLALSDTFTVDGYSFGAADDGTRILVKDQSTAAQNGIWTTTVSGTSLTLDRATDFDEDTEVMPGAFTFVAKGNDNADSGWTLTSDPPITIGGGSGTAINFSQFSGAGQITAGNGMTKSGNVLNAVGSTTVIAFADSLAVNSSTTANQILLSSGAPGSASTFGALPLGEIEAVSGTLAVANGGSGAATLTSGNFLQGNGTNAFTATKAVPTGDVVGTTDTQTLTNKTINTASNTITVAAADVTSGTFVDARIAESNVTQHEGAITIGNLSGAPTSTIVGTTDTQTLSNKTLTNPKISTNILDTNGNELLAFTATASAVNELTVTNAVAAGTPTISATGGDTNIDLALVAKGSGNITISGLTMPNADGTASQVLGTNGTGSIEFVDVDVMTNNSTTTTTAAATTISTMGTSTGTVYLVQASIVARRTDAGTEGAGFVVKATFRNDSGVLTRIAEDKVSGKETGSAWDTTVDVSGTNIVVKVTGEASKTINWTASCKTMSVN